MVIRRTRCGRGVARRILACVLAAAAALLVAACEPAPREELRFGLTSMPVTLDPRFATDAASARIIRLLYARLVDFDERAMPRPALADWERLAPTHYRFTLREGRAPFADGSPVTAFDVAATYEAILDEATASPHRLALIDIESVAAVGADVIDFHLRRPDPLFPGRLTVGIMPRALLAAGHAFNRMAAGSGPFDFVDWAADGELRLRRRHDGQTIAFLPVPDPTVRVLKVLRGEVDMIQNDLPPELVTYLRGRSEVQVVEAPGANFAYLGFNLRDPVTGRAEVRRAIAHALDREAIIEYVLGATARPAGAILPPEHWAGDATLTGAVHDPALARRLLDALGYGPGELRIVYKTSTDPVRLRLATVIQAQLAEAGIDVALRSYDWGTFYGDIRSGNFQMYSLSWVGIKLPEIFRYAFHSASAPPVGANRGFLADPVVDALIEEAEAAPAIEAQVAPLRTRQRHLGEALPYVPLWYEDHVFVARADVRGYRIAADGNYDSLVDVTRAPGASR